MTKINSLAGEASGSFGLSKGRAYPLGASFDGAGVNFAIFSANATAIDLCLFTADGRKELNRIPLREREGDVWHIYVEGMMPGSLYGYRVDGPYAPDQGHRFNVNKLLIDPYAKQLVGGLKWSDALMGYRIGAGKEDISFDKRDSAFAVPKCMVINPTLSALISERPNVQDQDRIIYEAHVKGFTKQMPKVDAAISGKFLGLASDASINHMLKLGITTVELLPVQSFITDRFLAERGLSNYWGYQTIGFFAPDNRYLSNGRIYEFQMMVHRLHQAGLEVILDVVYNHTGEGNEFGPTISFRGIDNASYYTLDQNPRFYVNHSGTGNMLDLTHPHVLRMVMDSLRYWVEVMHVDGFRFDLGTILAREKNGFDPEGGFLDVIRQDPILAGVKLIAEPWDIGPDGYQLGRWPHPFLEWNDKYRDDVRQFWRGDDGLTPRFARRILGSAEIFDHNRRDAHSSVNFISAHDGFTLLDTTKFVEKHNEANRENNQDGHGANFSDNFGVEGDSEDTKILDLRQKRMRNLMATLLLSQGTPMLLAGDEIGNSQRGNNNAYAQDNDIGWINWREGDKEFLEFVSKLIALRKAHPSIKQLRFLHARTRTDGLSDLVWRMPNGLTPTNDDWNNPSWKSIGVEVRMAATACNAYLSDETLFMIFNAGLEIEFQLPVLQNSKKWVRILDTESNDFSEIACDQPMVKVSEQSIQIFKN